MKITIFSCLTLVLLVQAQEDVSEELVAYYLKLLLDFQNKSSQWERPADNRKFFQPIDENAEPGENCFK